MEVNNVVFSCFFSYLEVSQKGRVKTVRTLATTQLVDTDSANSFNPSKYIYGTCTSMLYFYLNGQNLKFIEGNIYGKV
jgi:hypothetical protein